MHEWHEWQGLVEARKQQTFCIFTKMNQIWGKWTWSRWQGSPGKSICLKMLRGISNICGVLTCARPVVDAIWLHDSVPLFWMRGKFFCFLKDLMYFFLLSQCPIPVKLKPFVSPCYCVILGCCELNLYVTCNTTRPISSPTSAVMWNRALSPYLLTYLNVWNLDRPLGL